jgi:GT2 family glycosyltransferase
MEAGGAAAERPDVSIVVIAHDVRPELERLLDSIDRHAGLDVEVILVDQASTDGTAEWVAEAHPEVQVVRLEQNEGLAAREHGLTRAQGRFTMFIDSDARLTEGALPAMVRALEEHPDWGLVGPRLVYDDGSPQPSARRLPHPLLPFLRRPPLRRWFEDSGPVRWYLMEDFDLDRTRPVFHVLGACQLFRTELARRAGRFEGWAWGPDDADWCIRIRDAGGEVVYFADATVVHSYRRASSKEPLSRAALWHVVGFYKFQWKYRGRRREFARLERELDRRAGIAA